jgi:hypothetical protein
VIGSFEKIEVDLYCLEGLKFHYFEDGQLAMSSLGTGKIEGRLIVGRISFTAALSLNATQGLSLHWCRSILKKELITHKFGAPHLH